MDLLTIAKALESGGPYGLAAICMLAVGILYRAYVKARDTADTSYKALNNQLMTAQVDLTKHVERSAAGSEKVADALAEVARRLEDVERKVKGT